MTYPVIDPSQLPQNNGQGFSAPPIQSPEAPISPMNGPTAPTGNAFQQMTPQQQQMLMQALSRNGIAPASTPSIPALGAGGYANALSQGLQAYARQRMAQNQTPTYAPSQADPAGFAALGG